MAAAASPTEVVAPRINGRSFLSIAARTNSPFVVFYNFRRTHMRLFRVAPEFAQRPALVSFVNIPAACLATLSGGTESGDCPTLPREHELNGGMFFSDRMSASAEWCLIVLLPAIASPGRDAWFRNSRMLSLLRHEAPEVITGGSGCQDQSSVCSMVFVPGRGIPYFPVPVPCATIVVEGLVRDSS